MADSPRTSEFTTTVTSTHKCDLQPTESMSSVGIREQKGEVSEWLKEHAWKVCVGLYPTEGSNPSLTAINSKNPVNWPGFLLAGVQVASDR